MTEDSDAIMNDRRHTAVHEAGHAAISRVLTMTCGRATIIADHDSAGHHVVHDPWVVYAHWDQIGKYRDIDSVFRGRIMSFMAGHEAEEVLLAKAVAGDGDDRYQIDLMADELGVGLECLSRLRQHTRRLVRRHQRVIQVVADQLLKAGTLPGTEIDRMMAEVMA